MLIKLSVDYSLHYMMFQKLIPDKGVSIYK